MAQGVVNLPDDAVDDSIESMLQERESVMQERPEMDDSLANGDGTDEVISKGIPIDMIINICRQPPTVKDMENVKHNECKFMITPFKYDATQSPCESVPISNQKDYIDKWDKYHVRMPCSPLYFAKNGEPMWNTIQRSLIDLKNKCDSHTAIFSDLKETIEQCAGRHYEMNCLETLINNTFSEDERTIFMSTTLSNICSLALNVNTICGQPPPLLRIESNMSVTMSQQQTASLLACSFFCLFPFRSDQKRISEYEKFPNPNFNSLFRSGHELKIEKLKCIIHYFQRVIEKMPDGVITFRRYALPKNQYPNWFRSRTGLCDMHLTTGKRIEDVDCVLQVDFANKRIGGGVLSFGCVQEEIRFSICPEMLVSLLVCEMMESNECVFLIGCERYSSYKGYSKTFQFNGDYVDSTPKDNWGRKWCHLVAMDALLFHKPTTQYKIPVVERELNKAYTSFCPRKLGSDYQFGIATGSWGCGAFNGDRQLKAFIQLMAASEAQRPLIYAAYRDKSLVTSFADVYDYMKNQQATVGDLYRYLQRYSTRHDRSSLFEYILKTPILSLT